MISIPLLKRNIMICVKAFLGVFAMLCLYTITIIYMYNPKLSEMLSGYQEVLPDMMAAVGMTGIASNILEWMQIYLYGFIMMLFPLIFIIILVKKLLMEYIDNGSMANLLATPNSRGKIITTQVLSLVIWIVLLMVSVTVMGVISCEIMFPGELEIATYLKLNASTFLLMLALTGIAFLAACCVQEARHYYTVGAGLPILFFIIQMMSNMGAKLENFKYATIYTLLPAGKIVAGEGEIWKYNLALVGIILILYSIGIWQFCRRDLSL